MIVLAFGAGSALALDAHDFQLRSSDDSSDFSRVSLFGHGWSCRRCACVRANAGRLKERSCPVYYVVQEMDYGLIVYKTKVGRGICFSVGRRLSVAGQASHPRQRSRILDYFLFLADPRTLSHLFHYNIAPTTSGICFKAGSALHSIIS